MAQYEGKSEVADRFLQEALVATQKALDRWPDADGVHRVHRIQYLIAAGIARSGDQKTAKKKFQETVNFLDRHLEELATGVLRSDLAMVLGRLGQLQVTFNEKGDAKTSLTRSIDLVEQQLATQPENAYYIRNAAIGCDHLARFHLANKEMTQAVSLFETASASFRRLAELDPENARAKRDVILSLSRLVFSQPGGYDQLYYERLKCTARRLTASIPLDFVNSIGVVD